MSLFEQDNTQLRCKRRLFDNMDEQSDVEMRSAEPSTSLQQLPDISSTSAQIPSPNQ